MSVVNDGHKDSGGGSMADAVFEGMWKGASRPSRAVVGPLAEWDGQDPIVTKTARVLSENRSFESTAGPGAARNANSGPDPSESYSATVGATASEAKTPPPADQKKPVDSGPAKGVKGPAASGQIQDGGQGQRSDVSSNVKSRLQSMLRVKETAPIPRDLVPAGAMDSDYEKVGSALPVEWLEQAGDDVSELAVNERLAYAAVPGDGGWLRDVAADILVKEASSDGEYLVRDDVHPLKIVAVLDDLLGSEWREWEPETIKASLAKEAGTEPGDGVMDKIMAVKLALFRPELFYGRWQAFEKMAVAFNDRRPEMTDTERLSADEMANAVAIAQKLAGEGDFTPEVAAYVATHLFDEGLVVAPPQLLFADAKLATLVRDQGLRRKVVLAYESALKNMPSDESEDPIEIQARRMVRTHLYVMDRFDQGREQLGS
jgi:hypothetical protein